VLHRGEILLKICDQINIDTRQHDILVVISLRVLMYDVQKVYVPFVCMMYIITFTICSGAGW